MSNEKKPSKKTTPPLKVKLERELTIPKFCNLASVNTFKDSDEVILDFFYLEKQAKTDKEETPANFISRIAMTKTHAILLNKILTTHLAKKKK